MGAGRRAAFAAWVLGGALAIAVILEGLAFALLHSPSLSRRLGPGVRRVLREAYLQRPVRAFKMAEMARHDAELGYTLKPGRFLFAADEFAVPFEVNALGLRDSEEAARAPEIVVLGDSYAMGWGVRQEETLAKRLEALTGLKTLNAAISSYGTARQLRLLDRLDTSRLRYLVVQYCDNDIWENEDFRERGGLAAVGRDAYQESVARNERGYVPGDYARELARSALRLSPAWLHMSRPVPSAPLDLFYGAFAATRKDLSGVQVIVCEADIDGVDRWLLPLLSRGARARRRAPPAFLRRARVVRLSPELGEAHRFVLDQHWRAAGHELAARKIGAVVREMEAARQRDGASANIGP